MIFVGLIPRTVVSGSSLPHPGWIQSFGGEGVVGIWAQVQSPKQLGGHITSEWLCSHILAVLRCGSSSKTYSKMCAR